MVRLVERTQQPGEHYLFGRLEPWKESAGFFEQNPTPGLFRFRLACSQGSVRVSAGGSTTDLRCDGRTAQVVEQCSTPQAAQIEVRRVTASARIPFAVSIVRLGDC
ncbi:hypothetical protein ACMYYO_04835 [Dermacoccaceae bacterium W4C1]